VGATAVVGGDESGAPIRMAYTEAGDPHAEVNLLLLHGLFDQRGTWSYLTPHLVAAGFHVIAPDLIGFGASSRPLLRDLPDDERYSVDTQVAFLRTFIRQLDLDDLVLVGSSLGGGAALRMLCTAWPGGPRIRGLVLEAAAGHAQTLPPYIQLLAGVPGRLFLHPWVQPLALATGVARFLTRRTFRQVFFDPEKIPRDLLDDAVDLLRTPNTLYAYSESARNLIPQDIASFSDRYRDIDAPTLILWGRDDRIVPPLFALLFEGEIPDSTLHVFDECGHAPHLELPVETAVVIRDWMRRHISLTKDACP
jgi:pimeloyl-ACP methyl ester carboxylesterase